MNLDRENYCSYDRRTHVKSSDIIIVLLFAFLGILINLIPYDNAFSMFLQVFILSLTFIFFRNRPAVFFVVFIFLSILPSKLVGGFFVTQNEQYYALNSLITSVFLVLFVLYFLVYRGKKIKNIALPLVFIFLVFISYITSIVPQHYNFDLVIRILIYLFLPFLVSSERDIKLILYSHILSVLIFAVGVIPIITDESLYRGWINLNPNYASFFILTGLVSIVTVLVQFKKTSKIIQFLLGVIAILLIYTLVHFGSRTAFVMLFILFVLFLIYAKTRVSTIIVISLISLSVLFIFYEMSLFDFIIYRFQDNNASTGGNRLIIQRELLISYSHFDLYRILFGTGYLSANEFGLGMQAHNSYISILISFGLFGSVLYLLYLISIYKGLKVNKSYPYLIILVFLLIYSFSIEPYHIIEGVLMFSLLKAVACLRPQSYNGVVL